MAAMKAFVPRTEFPEFSSIVKSYFLGHHRAGLTKMRQMLGSVELIIECRDYRVPLSSRNPLFEKSLVGRERLIVYTKRDLASDVLDKKVIHNDHPSYCFGEALTRDIIQQWHQPHKVFFSDYKVTSDIQRIIEYAKGVAKSTDSLLGTQMMLAGMPNVGKSSLLNAMRRVGVNKGKVAITGGQPGVTRNIGTTVKICEDPEILLIDTPGVFIPYVPNTTTMLKLALVGCVKDTIIDPITLCDYLLYRLNLVSPDIYEKFHTPTNDVQVLLDGIARSTGRLGKGGVPDMGATALWLLSRYRAGELGRFILDNVDEEALTRRLKEESEESKSSNQRRKEIKAERMERHRIKLES